MQKKSVSKNFMHVLRGSAKEMLIGMVLGGLPVILNAHSAENPKEVLEILLATPFFIYYYGWLFALLMVLGVIIFRWWFHSIKHQGWLVKMHRFVSEVGAGLLTIARTGLGAMLGFMMVWYWVEPSTLNMPNFVQTLLLAVFTSFVCACLSDLDQVLKDPRKSMLAKTDNFG